jgi:hypothetical protein
VRRAHAVERHFRVIRSARVKVATQLDARLPASPRIQRATRLVVRQQRRVRVEQRKRWFKRPAALF